MLAQDLPCATAARLLGWQTGEPGVLSATTLRTLVRAHGQRRRCVEQSEANVLSMDGTQGKRLRGVPLDPVRRHAGWPSAWSTAVEAALAHGALRPPEGVRWSDGERVQAIQRDEVAASIEDLRRLGPEGAPGQMVRVLDEVLAPAPGRGGHVL